MLPEKPGTTIQSLKDYIGCSCLAICDIIYINASILLLVKGSGSWVGQWWRGESNNSKKKRKLIPHGTQITKSRCTGETSLSFLIWISQKIYHPPYYCLSFTSVLIHATISTYIRGWLSTWMSYTWVIWRLSWFPLRIVILSL